MKYENLQKYIEDFLSKGELIFSKKAALIPIIKNKY